MSVALDEDQQRAVLHDGSPLLVVAGPGSGKTSVIIERVLHLVKSGIKPSEILCLTFSEKAAEEMKHRLEKLIDISEMEISTFHSFAKDVLEDNVLESGIGLSSGVIKRSTQLVWGLKNIDDFKFEYLEIGNNAVDLVESIIDGISAFKNELISPEELDEYVKKKLQQQLSDEEKEFVLKLSDLCKVYHKYQEFQRGKAVIDFDDMVVQTVELFKKKPSVLTKYQKRFKHILVDEFQDNNFAQLEIVKLIAQSGNVTVVGDDDQSIYRFQGAYLTNFKDFTTHFPNTTVVVLRRNYRSSKDIVKLASQLLEGAPERQPKELYSELEDGEKVTVAGCGNESSEAVFVVKTIKELLGKPINRRDGTNSPLTYRDFIILSRRKLEGKKFARGLRAHGLPATFVGESNIFAAPVIRDIMAFLRIANAPVTSGIEITRLMKNHGITPQNIAKINHIAKKKAREDSTNADFVFETITNCDTLEITQKDELKDLGHQLQEIIRLENTSTIGDIVYKIIVPISGLYKNSIQSNTPENRRNRLLLKEFYQIALEYEMLNPEGTLDDFIRYLSFMGQFDLEITEGSELENSIQVTTIHQSKGREFPVVFIVDVATNKLPLRYQAKKFYVPADLSKGLTTQEDEKGLYVQEERRLFYVAMTRAQNLLFITYAKRYGQNVRETKPSKFLEEIKYNSNPLVNLVNYESTAEDVTLEEEQRIEKIKQELQEKAVRSINQMHLKSAVQRIIELAKVKHFEENSTTDNFDPTDVLKVDNTDGNLDMELQGKTIPLFNKEDLRLSASKIETYRVCPLRFKFEYILEVPTPPRTYFDIGNAVHAVAERLTELQKDGIKLTEDIALEILAKEWNANAFESETQENQAKESAKEMIKTYLKWIETNPNIPIAAEQSFQIEIGGIPFNGFIDRVERTSDGEFEVVDFKTGFVSESGKSIKENPQMNIYALGVQKLYDRLPKRTSLLYLKHDKIIPNEIEAVQVENVKASIEENVRAILNEEFEATPSYQVCRNCEFWDICESKETDE